MAAAQALQEIFSEVVSQAGIAAAAYGYARKQGTLRRIVGDNAALINFQRSRWNTSDNVSFTLNLSIVCGALLDSGAVTIKSAKEYDGHLRLRIGYLASEGTDKWWEVSNAARADVLSTEIASLVVSVAIPYLERYVRAKDLVALWETGQCPGLTEVQRLRYLARLKNPE